eukprot:Colp12_sorted_trinity150504_noHs@35410
MAEDEGRVVKMEKDFSSIVDEKLPEFQSLATAGRLTEALEGLMVLEKQTRNASDMHSTGRVLVAIAKLCFEAKEWEILNEKIVELTKKRGQLKQAVTKFIQEIVTYVDQTPNLETKLKLIDTLKTVTAGKIYVEIEHARLLKKLADIKESQGKTDEAAEILQELQVETLGSMDKREKVVFILEQMRLCLLKKDYIRTQIISKKITSRFFENVEYQDLKLKYCNLMISCAEHEGTTLEICKLYRSIFDTPSIQEDPEKWKKALTNVVIYLILSPFDNEQSDLVHRVAQEKKLKQLTWERDLLELFTTAEVMNWKHVMETYGGHVTASGDQSVAQKRLDELRKRVVEHNIRVISKYYTRITTTRLNELLDLPSKDSEEFLSSLVTNKTVFARIDRPAGVVSFEQKKDPNNILNDWSNSINTMMRLLEQSTHLITKEEMVHASAASAAN